MNLKDCIHIIKNCTMLACEYHIKDKCDYNYEVKENRFECAKEQAIKALEKQISYKPKEYEDKYYACKCGEVLLEKWEKYPTKLMPKSWGLPYCMGCGQKLDWS